jgi:hypothetical protein
MRSCAIRAIFKLSGASPSSDSETIFVASNGRITPKPADFHSHPLWDRRARKFLMTKWDRPRIRTPAVPATRVSVEHALRKLSSGLHCEEIRTDNQGCDYALRDGSRQVVVAKTTVAVSFEPGRWGHTERIHSDRRQIIVTIALQTGASLIDAGTWLGLSRGRGNGLRIAPSRKIRCLSNELEPE